MLMPKRTKYKKQMKGRNRGEAQSGASIAFGEIGLKAVEAGRIDSRQIDKPLTAKPLETRMGKGKGSVDKWVMNIKPGRIIFEMAGVPEELAREALTLAMHKLPFKTKIVTRESENEIY